MTGSSPHSPSSPPASPLSSSDERLWSSLAHFGNLLGFLPSLLIMLILGPRSSTVRQEARTALNFAITAALAFLALSVVGTVVSVIGATAPDSLSVVSGLLGGLIALANFAVWVAYVVLSIIAGVRVNGGGTGRYPFSLHLVR